MSKSAVAEAYRQYKSTPNTETYEAFGYELLKFMKAMLVIKYRRNYEKIEDALGEASIKVLSKLDSFKSDPEKFPSWVMTIALNEAVNAGKKTIYSDLLNEKYAISERDSLIESHRGIDAKLDVQKAMAVLTAEDRCVVEAKMRGENDEEIAEGLNIAIGTVKMRWLRAKDKMRTQLGGEEVE